MTQETAAERLGRLIRTRRRALKLTQNDVQQADGPSPATLRLIETGKHTDFRDGTGSALEDAIFWERGSIDTTLAGGDPTPLPRAQRQPQEQQRGHEEPARAKPGSAAPRGMFQKIAEHILTAGEVIRDMIRTFPDDAAAAQADDLLTELRTTHRVLEPLLDSIDVQAGFLKEATRILEAENAIFTKVSTAPHHLHDAFPPENVREGDPLPTAARSTPRDHRKGRSEQPPAPNDENQDHGDSE